MDKAFSPSDIESRIYAQWEAGGFFSPSGHGPAYSIVIPPPNVTGTLHMGHAFQDTIMDALIRYGRMRGFDTLWQPGMDHAGIATQMVVERQLNALGQSRIELGREAFVARVWEWKNKSGGLIANQLRRLGACRPAYAGSGRRGIRRPAGEREHAPARPVGQVRASSRNHRRRRRAAPPGPRTIQGLSRTEIRGRDASVG